ncbi:hypothetical protein NQZ68_006084 [Dissostichus eleginoides]|nr:hypothetical protein NQZ68_006084 [Dissostichus eleginoides]
MIWRCVRVLMETSPSQSTGQGGGVWWSVKTGHPTAVTDGFHQGAPGLTGEMYMETAAKGADIYLAAAPLARTQEERSQDGGLSEERHGGVRCKLVVFNT